MDQHSKEYLARMLSEISSINLSPVRNVRPWFKSSADEETFRVATSEEVFYISFPATFECEKEAKEPAVMAGEEA